MKHSICKYTSDFEEELNVPLMKKSSDLPLVDYVIDAWKSLEVVPNIKITSWEYTEKESDIDVNKYIFKREKKKKKKDRYDYKFINDDRYGKLVVNVEISLLETDKDTGKKFVHRYPIKKAMLIPLQDEDGYYFIKGKRYYVIYQLVEKSTYTSAQSVTLKSLMPIAVKRNIVQSSSMDDNNITDESVNTNSVNTVDHEGTLYNLPCYSIFVFRKEIPIILFYMSKGLDFALDYLEVSNVIDFVEEIPSNPSDKMIYFQISNKCYIEVVRELFNKYQYIQSIVGGFISVCTSRVSINALNDPKIWIKKISGTTYEKGADILKFFNRLLDETTKKILKVDEHHVQDIYTLLRWIMQNYSDLRLKDNMSLVNKRLRCNEYIASLLTMEFSKRLNRIISMGDKAAIQNYKDIFRFPGDRRYVAFKPI